MEQDPLFYLFVVLTIALAFAYFVGARGNKRRSRATFGVLEQVLQPSKKNYTNIGGLIGYNFNYAKLKAKRVSHINGVLTMLPRQSPLYLPIAKLLGRRDKLYMTIFVTNVQPGGAWHIVHSKCKESIDMGDLTLKKLSVAGESFELFYQNEEDFTMLERFITKVSPKHLRHMGYHPQDKSFAMYWLPSNFWQELKESYAFICGIVNR